METHLFKTEFLFEMEDWMNFQLHYLRNLTSYKRTKLFYLAAMPLIFFIFTLTDIYKGKFNFYVLLVYILFSVVWILFYKNRFEKSHKRRIQKLLNKSENKSILGLQTLIMEENHLTLMHPKTENKISYDGIEKAEETDDYLYLYNSSVSAVIIPKQKVGPEAFETIKNLIKEKITNYQYI